MSGWLAKATGVLRHDAPDEPQPFDIDCECGLQHSGLRRRRQQRIVCRSCGASLFVLPRDAYPAPLPPPPKKRKPRRKSGKRKGKSEERSAALPPPKQVARKAAATVAAASSRVGRGAAQIGTGLGSGLSKGGRSVRAFWKPFRLVVLGIVIVLVSTVLWTISSDRSAQAVSDLKRANETARTALAEGDVPTAHTEFTRAVAALDLLDRRSDPLAKEIRQLQRETTAMNGILSVSALEIVEQADRAFANDPGAASELIERRHLGRWLVLEGDARLAGAGPESGRYVFDIPFSVGESGRRMAVEVSLVALDKLKIARQPRAVILAGQLEACELSSGGRVWTLRLKSETAFLWTSPENYRALGFTFDDAETEEHVRGVLKQQARVMGLEQ